MPIGLQAAFCLAVFSLCSPLTYAALKPDQIPLFQWRARVITSEGKKPDGKKFSITFGVQGSAVQVEGDGWSVWTNFDRKHAEHFTAANSYPNNYMGGFPLVTHLSFNGIADPAQVQAEVRFDGGSNVVQVLDGELYGPSLGVLISKDAQGIPRAVTMAQYNRRYWDAIKTASVATNERPRKFPIVDRFIGGDNDGIALKEGISALAGGGFSAIMLPPDKKQREQLLATGNRRTAWAVYNPPGYAFDYDASITPEAVDKWAMEQVSPYTNAGYAREDMAVFAMSDEPGWYFPSMFKALTNSMAGMQRFRDYLKQQGLKPRDVGAARWEEALPLGRSEAKELPQKKLFYWTMRFFAWDSARHFAVSTRALEKAFYTNMPILVNWNFFAGRFYVPGAVANNPDKQSPDAAMGGHDWLEFGRMRGCTMLWTEDWFGDGMASQWSYYCARLRAGAKKGGVDFGGYVIPRTAGQRENGILQKIVTIVGCGGKCIKYFVFGPEYNFPGNCYSENVKVLPKMAEAHRMIGAAEELLWPGRMPGSEVAILMPRSAMAWDAKDEAHPRSIQDATNVGLNGQTVDYMAETYDLYMALQHANIPADIIEEEDLSAAGLAPVRVLYVTEPNVPAEGLAELSKWVKAGGVLVTVAGACQADRYNEPSEWMRKDMGIDEETRERLLIPNAANLQETRKGNGVLGQFDSIGPRSELSDTNKLTVLGTFDDGQAGVVTKQVKKGHVYHFAWFPGISYARSCREVKDGLAAGWSKPLRDWITHPVKEAGVVAPVTVDVPCVETPLLLSDAGAVITVLNWTGERIGKLEVGARLPFPVKSMKSVKHGDLKFSTAEGVTRFSLPADAADFVMIWK